MVADVLALGGAVELVDGAYTQIAKSEGGTLTLPRPFPAEVSLGG